MALDKCLFSLKTSSCKGLQDSSLSSFLLNMTEPNEGDSLSSCDQMQYFKWMFIVWFKLKRGRAAHLKCYKYKIIAFFIIKFDSQKYEKLVLKTATHAPPRGKKFCFVNSLK